jgi:hypothetical protein
MLRLAADPKRWISVTAPPYVQALASLEGSSHGARALARLGSDDLLIALAFPRYFADTVTLAGQAEQGRRTFVGIDRQGDVACGTAGDRGVVRAYR